MCVDYGNRNSHQYSKSIFVVKTHDDGKKVVLNIYNYSYVIMF